MAENVLADAQFTIASILRPFEGFEQSYQGEDVTTPIVFPGTLDDDAGKPGFSPYLLKGLAVPFGAKIKLWIPAIVALGEGDIVAEYSYVLNWRLRNCGDFGRQRKPYHLSKEALGAPDTLLAAPPDRYVLPCATEPVQFVDEPTEGGYTGIVTLRTAQINVPSDGRDLENLFPTQGLPLLPPNAAPQFDNAYPIGSFSTRPLGAFQQGIVDPAVSNVACYSMFRVYETIAKGDELIVSCFRGSDDEIVGSDKWQFGGLDFQFSNLYGTAAYPAGGISIQSHRPFPDLGIYVFAGSAP